MSKVSAAMAASGFFIVLVVVNLALWCRGVSVTELIEKLVGMAIVPISDFAVVLLVDLLFCVRLVGVEVDFVLSVLVVGVFRHLSLRVGNEMMSAPCAPGMTESPPLR